MFLDLSSYENNNLDLKTTHIAGKSSTSSCWVVPRTSGEATGFLAIAQGVYGKYRTPFFNV